MILMAPLQKPSFCKAVARLDRVDLLKLNCEGAEWEIFESEKECWNKVKNLTMEYHLIDHYTKTDVERKVKELGFEIIHTEQTGPTWGLLVATR